MPPEEEPKEEEFDSAPYGMEHLDNEKDWQPEVNLPDWYDW